jgi:uncharacterized damage-inducible protein DinB
MRLGTRRHSTRLATRRALPGILCIRIPWTEHHMPTIMEALAGQLQRSYEGPSWHGPSVREVLDGVTAKQAAAHPIAGAHSIWELVLHMSAGYHLVLRRLAGDGRNLSPEEDWPAVPEPTETAWHRDVEALFALNRQLRDAVERFPEPRLHLPLVDEPPYTAFMQFAGMPQHDLYHAGQIVLLRRALRG